jgi:putative molybdopterin biosynthesis protein
MRVVPTLGWQVAGERDEALDARLLPLLAAVAARASLAAAVADCGISYRAAWGLLRDYGRTFGAPLVRLERGRGARLTASGERLLQAQVAARERLARVLPGLAVDVGPAPRGSAPHRVLPLHVAASHDLALAALSELLPGRAAIALELSVMGSLHALREFAEGRADAAGFHVPIGRQARWDRAPFLRWLRPQRDRLVRFVDREQGLMLARGNPAHVRSMRDVADRNLRFVNRQRGSGTRLLVDGMIAAENLEASAIHGYGSEEFTHAAVAATVASGGADAGFGLRAAAAEYGLAFVPLARERYFFAVRSRDVDRPPVAALIQAMRGAEFARRAQRLPGYKISAAGSITGPEALLPASKATSTHSRG